MYRGGSQRDIQWCLIRHDGPFPGVINAEQRGEINDASAGLRHSPSLTIYCHTTESQEKLSRRDDRTFTELMKLARFIQTGMGQLLEDFGEAALEIAPELKGEDSRALEDHAREMLEFITEDLLTPQTARESARKALGKAGSPASMAGNRHGSGRHGQGLSMLQTIQELRALRARVMKAWSDSQQGLSTDDFAELLRFNEAIDQLIVSSVASYTALKEQEAHLFEAMLRASPDPSAIFDPDGKYCSSTRRWLIWLIRRLLERLAKRRCNWLWVLPWSCTTRLLLLLPLVSFSAGSYIILPPRARRCILTVQLVPVFDDRSEIKAVAKVSRDITERKKTEREIWRSANFDSLTGISNRRLFLDRLEQSLLEAKRQDRSFALLFIDLDRFKQANDQLGHSAGDRLLKQVAERISTNVRAMDTLARLGGDEFTLIFKDVNREDAKNAAEVLLTCIERPYSVDAHQVHLSGSIGVALFPDDGNDADQLMHNADQAMYAAKESGGHQVRLHQV